MIKKPTFMKIAPRGLKEEYQLKITLVSQYILEISKAYNKPIRDIGDECILSAINLKYKKDETQQVLPIEQTLLPIDKNPYLIKEEI